MTLQTSVEPSPHTNGARGKRKAQLVRLASVGVVLTPLAFALRAEFPLCPSAGLLGLPCPGCGLTRASLLLASGEFAAAFALHPLVIPLAPLYFGAIGLVLLDYIRGPADLQRQRMISALPSKASRTRRRWITAFGLLLLVATLGLWGARFAGIFGGPAPVESYGSWASQHGH